MSDMGVWDGEIWAWNLIWRMNLYQWEEALVLVELLRTIGNSKPSFSVQDIMSWIQTSDGIFFVKSFVAGSSKVVYS